MKATGIVRKLDPLGRLVIPKETRRLFNLNGREPVEIFTDGDKIIIKKYNPGCQCCGNMENVKEYKGIKICKKCLNELNNK